MFEPMFTNEPGLFGIPAMVFIIAVAALISGVGVVWLRRATEIEPDVHSFRTNQPAPRDYRSVLIGTGVGILAVLALWLTVTNNWGLIL